MPQRAPGNSLWLYLIAIVALGMAGMAVVQALNSMPATSPAAVPSNSVTVPLSATTPAPYSTDRLAQKQTAEAAVAQTSQADISTAPPHCITGTPPTFVPPPTYTPEPFVAGIFNSQGFQQGGLVMSNWWTDIVDGEKVRVYVGAREDNPGVTEAASQGIVLVSTTSADETNWDFFTYEAPYTNTGVLIITAANGYRLTLRAQWGAVLYFDVPTRQFVSSLSVTSSAPTATRLPNIPPTATPGIPTPVTPPTSYPGETLPTPNPTAGCRSAYP